MTNPTRTINPIHFEDLEPKRFEDFVRQLVYDFRNWRSLEPTGRLGSDDGYDARGYEIVGEEEVEDQEDNEKEDEQKSRASLEQDRLWQIQCKRERSITPRKLEGHITDMIKKGADIPYGVIFAAPCDFSKQSRDTFREEMAKLGVQEFHLWGKADLEDMLYQPKNDYLLYAFFGISLQIRRRSQKSRIRSNLVTKRKIIKYLGTITENSFKEMLLRDIDDTHYPYSDDVPNFKENPAWKKYYFVGHTYDGIRILVTKFYAYRKVEWDKKREPKLKKWDYTDKVNLATCRNDYWNNDTKNENDASAVSVFSNEKIQKENQAYFEIERVIRYDNILEIDPDGDVLDDNCPHLYIRRIHKDSFFEDRRSNVQLVSRDGYGYSLRLEQRDEKTRISFFPKTFPTQRKEKTTTETVEIEDEEK
jgi:hypothetical protein